MNRLVKRGLKAYNIFLKNKLAAALMMFIPGLMMTFAAINGNGNDTKTLPLMILIAGAVFSFWSCYRLGYIKSNVDKATDRVEKREGRKILLLQVLEAAVYLLIASLGVFLLMNEQFTNKILNLMAGGFTTFNGVLGAISTFKKRDDKDFYWKFVLVLTLFELGFGIYFLLASDSIGIGSYLLMGIITTIAGTLAVVSCLNVKTLKETIEDGKDIVETMKGESIDQEEQARLESGEEDEEEGDDE